jgi:hypothetical protein
MNTLPRVYTHVNPHPLTARRMPRKGGTPAPAHIAAMVAARQARIAAQLTRKGLLPIEARAPKHGWAVA